MGIRSSCLRRFCHAPLRRVTSVSLCSKDYSGCITVHLYPDAMFLRKTTVGASLVKCTLLLSTIVQQSSVTLRCGAAPQSVIVRNTTVGVSLVICILLLSLFERLQQVRFIVRKTAAGSSLITCTLPHFSRDYSRCLPGQFTLMSSTIIYSRRPLSVFVRKVTAGASLLIKAPLFNGPRTHVAFGV